MMTAAEQVGPQPGIFVDKLLPPLRHTPGILAAMVIVLARDAWADIPLEQIDPRAPWRQVNTATAQNLPGIGSILIFGDGPSKGWKALLLTHKVDSEVLQHQLCHAGLNRPVHFGSRYDAQRALEPIVHADGAVPCSWAWNPLPDLLDARWTPVAPGKHSLGPARIIWRGRSGQWRVEAWPNHVTVALSGKRITDNPGVPRLFTNVRAAKAFCLREDGR